MLPGNARPAHRKLRARLEAIDVYNERSPLNIVQHGKDNLAPFSMGQTWDASQSNVIESKSAGQHLRFAINNQNWWGAAAYIMDNYSPVDISSFGKMTLRLKANKPVRVKFFLISMETNAESEHTEFDITTSYQTITIDLAALAKAGFDLKSPQGFVLATSVDGDQAYVVDADDVTVE
jgi:hypothetical protein